MYFKINISAHLPGDLATQSAGGTKLEIGERSVVLDLAIGMEGCAMHHLSNSYDPRTVAVSGGLVRKLDVGGATWVYWEGGATGLF